MSGSKKRGRVASFDVSSGRGVVRGEDGELYLLHYSSIKTKRKFKTLAPNQKVKFVLYEHLDHSRIKVIEPC